MHPERIDGQALTGLYRAHLDALLQETRALLAQEKLSGFVIHAGSPRKVAQLDDRYYPFQPTPHLVHFAPVLEPHAVLVVRPGERPKLLRERVTSYWERPAPLEWDGFLASFDVGTFDEGEDPLALLPSRAGLAFLGDEVDVAERWGFERALWNPPGLVRGLHALRTKKSAYEVACMAIATERAARGHKAVLEAFRTSDLSELALHLTYLGACGLDDSEVPYKNIVALGANAAVLHHINYGRVPPGKTSQSLLVDAGGKFLGYASDITRTWARGSGGAIDLFRALVNAVDAAQAAILDDIRPGLPYEDLHDESHHKLAKALVGLGIVRGSADEAVASGVTRALFPHGLGHSLGIQVHDVGLRDRAPKPNNPFLRHTGIIEEGQVFTIEPGIYFIDSLLEGLRGSPAGKLLDWTKVEALAPFGGVRIEDNVVVGAPGEKVRNLTREFLPRSLAA